MSCKLNLVFFIKMTKLKESGGSVEENRRRIFMNKTIGVSPITDKIYYGTAKNDKWRGKGKMSQIWQLKMVYAQNGKGMP